MIFNILIIPLGGALILVFFRRKKDEEKARRVIIGLAAVIVLLVVVRLVTLGTGPPETHHDTAFDHELGSVAADRIAEIATGRSAVIVVPIRMTAYMDARTKGVEEQL